MDEQTAKNQKENSTRKSLNKQDSLVLKIVLIAFLILLSFIPMSMIRGLINEREMTANAAAQEVQQKWSKSQTLIGPILTIPYFYQNEKGENQKGYINYLPEQLNITGDVNTQELKRGLYEIIVYNSKKAIYSPTTSGLKPPQSTLESAISEESMNKSRLNGTTANCISHPGLIPTASSFPAYHRKSRHNNCLQTIRSFIS